MTHTELDNQQRRIWASPLLPPGCPAPACSLFGLHPTRFLGGRGGSCSVGLSAPSVAASWTSGGGHGETSLGLLPPRAGAATVGCCSPGRGPALGHHSPPSPWAG